MGPRRYKRDTTAGNRALTTTYGYDALNRLVSAHREGVGVNTTCTYQYDSLGNLIRQEQDGCEEYRYNGYQLDESKECGVIGTCRWEYTYDGRGNLISEDKYTRTTTGMDWQNVATYVYDETNRLVDGRNEQGERSLYTYNGLGVRVGRELIVQDNTHGYTDFHSGTPSVETGIDKPEVVKESYVVDYTTATRETLTMTEEGGFAYRWVYGLDKLSVKITSEGTNWWGQNVKQDILKDYTHQDRLGSTTNLTDKFGRVVGRADYNEWGEMTYREALSITSSYRRIWPQSSYTGHDWDDVLGMYYAKARFYSAEDKRFVAMDPIKGSITDPMSLVPYVYVVDNPLRWVDPLGLRVETAPGLGGGGSATTSTQKTLTVTEDGVRMRAAPGSNGPIIGSLKRGDTVISLGQTITASGLAWDKVKVNGQQCWVASKYLESASSTTPSTTPVGGQTSTDELGVIYTVDSTAGLKLRSAPSLSSKTLEILKDGTPVISLGENKVADGYHWLKVSANGQVGWMASELLQKKSDLTGAINAVNNGSQILQQSVSKIAIRVTPKYFQLPICVLQRERKSFFGLELSASFNHREVISNDDWIIVSNSMGFVESTTYSIGDSSAPVSLIGNVALVYSGGTPSIAINASGGVKVNIDNISIQTTASPLTNTMTCSFSIHNGDTVQTYSVIRQGFDMIGEVSVTNSLTDTTTFKEFDQVTIHGNRIGLAVAAVMLFPELGIESLFPGLAEILGRVVTWKAG